MHRSPFKLFVFALFCVIFVIFGLKDQPVGAFQSGPNTRNTGAPGETDCTSCHGGAAVNSGTGTLTITGLPPTYTPNQDITVTVTLGQSGRSRFGFQLTAIDDQGRRAGDFVLIEPSRTQLGTGIVGPNLRQYIFHTFAGTTANGANQSTWNFTWKAPAQSVGRVTFYAAGNATNSSSSEGGDFIYTKNASIQPGSVLGNFASVSAASFAPEAVTAADAILAGFGTGLAQSTLLATSTPLPTLLGDTEVEVKDFAGNPRLAGLFFVSAAQINYLVPVGTINGAATITVKRGGTPVALGTITVDTAAPGLFSANADGLGVPAAVLFRRSNNVDTTDTVSQPNAQTGKFEPKQLDLGPEGDIVALIAFGTGFRNALQSSATCTIGGETAQVLFSGPQGPTLAGLDQTNLLIPRSLIGRGLVNVVFSVGGKNANILQINIK